MTESEVSLHTAIPSDHSDYVRTFFPEISTRGVDLDVRGHKVEVKEERCGYFRIKEADVVPGRSTWVLFYSHSYDEWWVVKTGRLKGGRNYRPGQIYRLASLIFLNGEEARDWFDRLTQRNFSRPDDWLTRGDEAAEAW